jgi:hypothetical protein
VKKVALTPKDLPELFGPDSLQEFLFGLHQVNTDVLYRDPTKAGWRFAYSLHGEGEAAPELFRIYEKNNQRMVGPSDFVNQSVSDSSAATSADQYDPGTPKALQAQQSRDWSSLISTIHFFDSSSAKSIERRRLHARLIAKGVSEMILGTLDKLLASSQSPDDQALIAKEAGAAYESGLKNFLTSTGAREKKGKTRQSMTIVTPWERLAIYRVQQFVVTHGTLPNQTWLIQQLKQDGVVYHEDNGRGHSKWRELLKRAGLDSLPKMTASKRQG